MKKITIMKHVLNLFASKLFVETILIIERSESELGMQGCSSWNLTCDL